MKSKRPVNPSPARPQRQAAGGDDRRRASRRRIWLWLVAVFLVLTFLAGECATLLPVQ